MEVSDVTDFIQGSTRGVLITLKRDGRPQASNVMYSFNAGVARISVTAGRAKTKNLQRDGRASLYVTSDDFWAYVVAEGDADLSAVSASPGDAAGRELLDTYESIRGEAHPDPDEFFQAMVDDQRLIIRLHVDRVYGQAPRV